MCQHNTKAEIRKGGRTSRSTGVLSLCKCRWHRFFPTRSPVLMTGDEDSLYYGEAHRTLERVSASCIVGARPYMPSKLRCTQARR